MITGDRIVIDSLQALLYGMVGIFAVMGIIAAFTTLLNHFFKEDAEKEKERTD